jgi:hypothetical protein
MAHSVAIKIKAIGPQASVSRVETDSRSKDGESVGEGCAPPL